MSPSAARHDSRPAGDGDPNGPRPAKGRAGLPPLETTAGGHSSSPIGEPSGRWRSQGAAERWHSRAPDEVAQSRRSQPLDGSPKDLRGPVASPELPRARSCAAGDLVAAASRRCKADDPDRCGPVERRPQDDEDRHLPPSLRLPPPLRLPDCRHLARGLRAHLEAYRRARQDGERAVKEAVEAAFARYSSLH